MSPIRSPYPLSALFVTILVACPSLTAAPADPSSPPAVTAKLIADVEAIEPGKTFHVGVEFTIEPGWHIYWKHPGESGLATSVDFTLPEGFAASPLRWPRPTTFTQPGNIEGFGYANRVLLYVSLTPPADLKTDSTVTLQANASWLACKDKCVTGEAALELTLPVAEQSRPAHAQLFADAIAQTDPVAPAFSLKDQDGREVKLSDYAGKIVVLEWINPDCPFVQYHYQQDVNTMVKLAEKYAEKGVIWLAVNTTHYWTAKMNKAYHDGRKLPFVILDDHEGKVGRLYNAKATPHMFIIDPDGLIAYQGAIDNAPRGKVPSDAEKVNYVAQALDELLAGKPVSTPQTKAYGCSVKYAPK